MLSSIQGEGAIQHDPGRAAYGTSVNSWLRELVDVTLCLSFQQSFGITIGQFLKKYRGLSDEELKHEAQRLAGIKFAALGGQQGANRGGSGGLSPQGIPPRRRGRFLKERTH
jgi:hypothetical protein